MSRYSYGATICTFNGASRVEVLLKSLEKSKTLSLFDKKFIIEDKVPNASPNTYDWSLWKTSGVENHKNLLEVVKKYPEWKLVSLEHWGNMQGCANRAFEECDTDFIWYLSDDIISMGDPFKHFHLWAENVPEEIMDVTGAVSPVIYNSLDSLVSAGWLRSQEHRLVHLQFYTDPFNTWLKDKEPVQFNTNFPQHPCISGQVNGATFILRKNAWREVGGIDPHWDVLDQELSYSIYLETSKIIYLLASDPFYHCGGCAQNSSFESLMPDSKHHRKEERCIENFGDTIANMEKKVHGIAREREQVWGPKLVEAFVKLQSEIQGFQWKWL